MTLRGKWEERYRPKTLVEYEADDGFKRKISYYLEKGMPNLMFVGPPGIGKTTLALIIGLEICGNEGIKFDFMEINASHERDQKMVRRVIDFARCKPWNGGGQRIVLFDEGDTITDLIQQALRRILEKYGNCIFIFTGNDRNGFIPAIQSRCRVFDFTYNYELIRHRLEVIASKERMEVDKATINRIAKESRGDFRTAIQLLYEERAS